MTRNLIISTIANTLGVDPEEISINSEFQLDLNATQNEMQKLKTELEHTLEIELPEFNEDIPATVNDLFEMVEDAML